MKYEIKQVNDTNAVVILDKEPKINDWYNSDLGINKLGSTTRYVEKYRHKVIATILPFKIEGLPMLELPNQEEDVEKLFKDKYKSFRTGSFLKQIKEYFAVQLMMIGYKAAQKQYSEEDMRKAITMARDIKDDSVHDTFTAEDISGCTEVCTYGWKNKYSDEDILQSLQKKQFPIAVELTEDFKPLKWHYE